VNASGAVYELGVVKDKAHLASKRREVAVAEVEHALRGVADVVVAFGAAEPDRADRRDDRRCEILELPSVRPDFDHGEREIQIVG